MKLFSKEYIQKFLSDVTSNDPKTNAGAMSQITKDAVTYERTAYDKACINIRREIKEHFTSLEISDIMPIPHYDINKKFTGLLGCCVHCLLYFEADFKKDIKRMLVPHYIKQKTVSGMENIPAHYSYNTVYKCGECDKSFDINKYIDWIILNPPNPEMA